MNERGRLGGGGGGRDSGGGGDYVGVDIRMADIRVGVG